MFNYTLAREIYSSPWLMDSESFGSLFSMLAMFRSNGQVQMPETKYNSCMFYDLKSVDFVEGTYDLRKADQNAELINIVSINGPITKGGGQSSYGTKDISRQMLMADKDNRVKGHIIMADSGGGSTSAVQFMTDAIAEASKPVVSFIEKGAIAGSAMYGIISKSKYIVSERANNRVGSIGTYMEFGGLPKTATLENGVKYVRLYATKSDLKNFEFEQAINNDNYKPMIENVLDPTNEEFINEVVANRPKATKEQLRGKMMNAGDAVGSLVDEIGSFQVAVNKVLELSNIKQPKPNSNAGAAAKPTVTQNSKQIINTNKNKSMTVEELRSQHPDTYNAIFNAGVSSERDRAGAWLAHVNTNAQKVAEGIRSGEQISNTQREEFFVQLHSLNRVSDMQQQSAPSVNTPQSTSPVATELTDDQKVSKALEDAFNFKLD